LSDGAERYGENPIYLVYPVTFVTFAISHSAAGEDEDEGYEE
jgi:hypothetical protein